MTSPESFPVEEARKKFADILDGTQFRSTHTEITRRGKPAGYVVPPEWYAAATETLAEVAELRRQVEELSAARKPSPAATTPRQQVTQAVRKPVPSISSKVLALPLDRIVWLVDKAETVSPEWVEGIRQEYPHLQGPDLDYLIVDLGHQKGFKIPELDNPQTADAADRPVTEAEAAEFAAHARSKASEMQLKKLKQIAETAADGSKDFAVMHAAIEMELLTHDEVYADPAPERPVSSEEKNA